MKILKETLVPILLIYLLYLVGHPTSAIWVSIIFLGMQGILRVSCVELIQAQREYIAALV